MTAQQYRSALKQLDMSIIGAGNFLGVSKRQSQRYAEGDAKVPGPLAILLRTMIAHHIRPCDLK